MSNLTFPKKHVSIRVPWHDTSWDGHVCANPSLNGACLKLPRIAQSRDDIAENAIAGKSLEKLDPAKWPCCVGERMTFMAPFEITRTINHPYQVTSPDTHGHFKQTSLRYPKYSAAAVPFSWMLKENMASIGEEFGIDVQLDREPELQFDTSWTQDRENQKALLDCFCDHLKLGQSLCFFYAKQVPFVDDAGGRRILIGVGRVLHASPGVEYEYTTKNPVGKLRSMLWERMIQHSIRPDFKDGFLLPYHAAMELASKDSDFDPASIVAFSPEDRLLEFSHASQLVTHDGAIASLLSCTESLRNAKGKVNGPWNECLKWIDQRIGELWVARGPCPGLGSALCAFGIELGTIVARAIYEKTGENADPWPLVDKAMSDPKRILPSDLTHSIGTTLQTKWKRLTEERRNLLKLVSRFEINSEQAKLVYIQELRKEAFYDVSDQNILENPYLLYEVARLTSDPISLWSVDRGVFPDETIRTKHPLPEPAALDTGTDARRVRALSVKLLEDSTNSGNTLMPQDQLVLAIRKLDLKPGCDVDGDLLDVAKEIFGDTIVETPMADGKPALQLSRISEMGKLIRDAVEKRIKGKRLSIDADWRSLLDNYLNAHGTHSHGEQEEKARIEKTAALKELSESRLSVLIGPAGTGKTTLLSVLCSHPLIAEGDILLLAPTGKARVRMEQATSDLKLKGFTVAQFLSPERYDASTGRYKLSEKNADAGAKSVIIDEASMLTEEMLAALIQALKGVHRLILIGDPRQLPPIGSGRPFVDIVRHLSPKAVTEKFPRVGPGYAELSIRRRQAGEEREDLCFAEWFSGSPIAPGEDDVFDKVVKTGSTKHVHFVQWDSANDLQQKLIGVLVDELKLYSSDDYLKFDESLGGKDWNGKRFFNFGSAVQSESWQILSPVRTGTHGVPEINRLIHKQFRKVQLEESRKTKGRKYPKPMGPEEIVYGDKVINLVNTDPSLRWNKHRKVYPNKEKPYIANGEIGMVIGFFWKKGLPDRRWKLEVEFSSQPKFKYDFTGRDFGEEANPVLELAYALTVHKSQGSEFGTVILVLPNPCRLVSRELLYTALTRQRNRVVLLHQGARSDLLKYSSDDRSETARRLTNLFDAPSPIIIDGRFFEENLIHKTAHGEMVRSKSEVIIADRLYALKVEYGYEQPLKMAGVTKYPDFTIDDIESGRTFYWEHCGMLNVPSYRKRWEEKMEWYKANGILPHEEGGGQNGCLIITRESAQGGISSQDIEGIIRSVIL